MIQAVTAALLNSQPDTTINENSLFQTTNVKRLMWPFPVAMNNKVLSELITGIQHTECYGGSNGTRGWSKGTVVIL